MWIHEHASIRHPLGHSYRDKLPLLAILVLSSGLSVAMLVARVWYSGHITYAFLQWNLLLAWIPLFSALALWRLQQSGMPGASLLGGVSFLCWLAFFPNAPYIVTDFLHLTERNNVPLWYDLLLLFSFAWNGLVVGFASLWIVQSVIAQRWGPRLSWLIVAGTLAVSGFGVYLGRFLRWNSWDVLTNPQLLAADILQIITNPLAHPRTIVMTLLFSTFLTLAYLTIGLLGRVRWQQSS